MDGAPRAQGIADMFDGLGLKATADVKANRFILVRQRLKPKVAGWTPYARSAVSWRLKTGSW
jgi:hypothetical protein